MEVIASDAASVTIKFRWKEDYSKMLRILGAFDLALEEGKIDMERLMLSSDDARRAVDAFYEAGKRA